MGAGNPVKPSRAVRRGRPLPKALSSEQMPAPVCPDRSSDGPRLVSGDPPLWAACLGSGPAQAGTSRLGTTGAAGEVRGKGRKDRRVYMSPMRWPVSSSVTAVSRAQAQNYVFWNRKRAERPLSVQAIQKKMERYAKSAGIVASCHSLRHTFASNLLEHGAEVVAIRDFLGISRSPPASGTPNARVRDQTGIYAHDAENF